MTRFTAGNTGSDALEINKRVSRKEVKQAGGIRAYGKPESILYDVKYVLPRDAVDGRL